MQYVSAGDAFSSSLEQSLMNQELRQRQAQQDALARQREERQNRRDQEERSQAAEALAEKRKEFGETQLAKKKTAFEKTLESMVPGDIPSPELVEQAKQFGMGHLFPEAEPTPMPVAAAPMAPPPAMPAVAPEGGIPAPVAPAPPDALAEELPKPILPPKPAGVRFLGSPTQRMAAKEKDEALAYAATLPAGPQRQAVEYFIKTGKAAPAGMFKTGGDNVPIYKSSPNRQVVEERQPDGSWLPVKGDVQKDGHWLQEPTAPAVHDNSLQKENQRTGAYNHAVTELNKVATPFEDQLKNIESAEEVLNERSPSGDAHVAPMVLKALVAGQGSGFRMTKSEIDQVQNARSKWQSMEAAFRKWSVDPKEALFFDDAQRGDFLKLLATMKVVTARHLEQVGRARNDIDLADNPRDIQKRLSKLHDERMSDAKGDDKKDTTPAAPKRVRYDINGKPVK